MSNARNDFVIPIAVLTVICLVITSVLALTEQATTPIIEQTEKANAETARKEVLPAADGFELLELSDLPDGVTEVYNATNGAGTVVMAEGKGYGGVMKIIVGIDGDGKITGTKTLSQSETAGLGSKTAEPKFQSQFPGQDESLAGVSTISGATISSKCFIGAVKKAFEAQKIAQGGATQSPLQAKMAQYYPNAEFKEVTGGIQCGDAGNVVLATEKGYGGDLAIAVLFDVSDKVIDVVVVNSSETEGLGSKVSEEAFTSKFVGKTSSDGIDSIAGATVSSNAFKKAFNAAVSNLSAVKGA
ncbi:MAG TPA: FMN-binding protein [Clostridia bacterium]|nr:FMN-binding protein [Clostridia bacterium]